MLLMLAGIVCWIEILQVKCLNNRIEQDNRYIKETTKPMIGFGTFHSATTTIVAIEIACMIRKAQLFEESLVTHKQFMVLAA